MKKILALLLVSLLVITGCSTGGGSKLADEFTTLYGTDIDQLDYLVTQKATNGDHIANFIDGLLENNSLGEYVPAMAESWKVSDDGKTYTYKIREGVQWVTNESTEYGEVTAHDWVTGLKHAADKKSETLYIAESIVNLSEYVSGEVPFEEVGVKALSDYELEYTLQEAEPFWNTKLTYGIMFPVNEKFLQSKGADFGTSAADSILYNGPYILTNNTAKSVIEYEKNESYWDLDNVHINAVKFMYNDGKVPEDQINMFRDGKVDVARVFPNSAAYEDVAKEYEGKITNSLTIGSTFNVNFNFARRAFDYTSKTTPEQFESTEKAKLNKNFRKAIQFAFDRPAYQAQSVGEANANNALRNTLVPPVFIVADGKDFGQLVHAELMKIDPTTWEGRSLADGQDAFNDADVAKAFFAEAKKELEAEGVTFPIHLDMPVDSVSVIAVNRIKSLKESVEKTLGAENVVIDIQLLSNADYLSVTYQAKFASDKDYDLSNASGWGPDYVDASTYLDIYNSRNGAMLMEMGLDSSLVVAEAGGDDVTKAAKDALGIAKYDELLDAAAAVKDVDERAKAYAVANAWLDDAVLQMPVNAGGGVPRVTKVVPFTAPYAWNGLQATRYKYVEVQEEPVTQQQFDDAKAAWEKARAK